jgi:hypothetical protein
MADNNNNDDEGCRVKITAHVLFHTIVPGKTTANGAKSKSKPKEKKDTKAKDFQHSFKGTLENYTTLLATILAKHGEEKYNVTEKMIFGIKVQLPSVKYNIEQCTVYFSDQACRKGDAVDIDTFEEYKELVVDILESLPTKMNIYIDMADVEKRWSKVSVFLSIIQLLTSFEQRGSHGSDNDDEDAELYNTDGLSDLDRELARLRGKLEKKYQNDHNAGYTYIDPRTGASYALTPQMMKE